MTTAIYERVSTNQQSLDSQHDELLRWVKHKEVTDYRIYEDKFTGKTLSRPGMNRLMDDLKRGKIKEIVCWRLDRLGRNCSELCQLFELITSYGANFISLRDNVDLSTPTGRMVAQIISSVAEFERESISQRVRAGQDAARARGKTWGGSQKGWRKKEIEKKIPSIFKLHKSGSSKAEISRVTGISYPTIHNLLSNKNI